MAIRSGGSGLGDGGDSAVVERKKCSFAWRPVGLLACPAGLRIASSVATLFHARCPIHHAATRQLPPPAFRSSYGVRPASSHGLDVSLDAEEARLGPSLHSPDHLRRSVAIPGTGPCCTQTPDTLATVSGNSDTRTGRRQVTLG